LRQRWSKSAHTLSRLEGIAPPEFAPCQKLYGEFVSNWADWFHQV
jgi:hypothetical protein